MTHQLRINVKGAGSVSRKAEQGVLYLRISSTSTSQSDVATTVSTCCEALAPLFREQATSFTVSPPTTSSYVPPPDHHAADQACSTPRAREYTATTTAQVVFSDMARLAGFGIELAALPDVAIERTEWRLTDATREQITREARIGAVREAVQKANDYAAVVGRAVEAVRIQDTGDSPQHNPYPNPAQHKYRRPMIMGGGHVPDGSGLEESMITVSANVQVDFVSVDGDVVP